MASARKKGMFTTILVLVGVMVFGAFKSELVKEWIAKGKGMIGLN